MDVGMLLSVVQTLLAALSSSQLKEAWSMWDYKSNLDELMSVVVTIKKVLLDAEAKYDQLSEETLHYIEELSFALYDADDLIDEFVTLANQKQLLQEQKFKKKVGRFFSRNNPLGVAYTMSKEVNKIMTKLEGIANRHNKFGLSLDHNPIRKRRADTCSYTNTKIIGRDEDVEKIVRILIDSDVSSSLSIVGMGGLGKTALAQLVFNHETIKSKFPLRLWACVSDDDQSNLDVKSILAQILESASGQKSNDCSMEVVVSRVKEVLLGKRFLIVLDDLWTESRDELQNLLGHMVGGQLGSQIVVTTRSKETAKIVGKGLTYELRGLSNDDSWHLFQLIAFDQVVDFETPNNDYADKINIGKDIVNICANVPLAIRVVGSLLYEQDKSKWQNVQKFGLANLGEDEIGIIPILKLSYYNLETSLKSCFSYCSLFPKDYRINKDKLIRMWIAQGYVVPHGNAQSVEDVSEDYFLILLRRCFFQDLEIDGGTYTFKLHDLMHDIALEISKKEICPANPCTRDMDKVVRHVSLFNEQHASFGHINPHIRTYHRIETHRKFDRCHLLARLVNCKRLRTLDLSCLHIKALPASIGKLIHLRHLNLSLNSMKILPNSITKLHNLQTLDLTWCDSLKELPKNFSNLVNLRVLMLVCCFELTLMPFSITWMSNQLIYLELPTLKVNAMHSSLKQQLEGLKALKMLRGSIIIDINLPSSDVLATQDNTITEGGYIRDMEHLNSITLDFNYEERHYAEELLGALQPHENLKNLRLRRYKCVRVPRSWAIEDNLTSVLHNLVELWFWKCGELKRLPFLGNLQNLKGLTLEELSKLEYMETPLEIIPKHGEASEERSLFFPCLEKLALQDLPKFKGWGRSGEIGGIIPDTHQSSLVFNKLINLNIWRCPNLTSLPGCPNVKNLRLWDFNERLRITSNPTSCLKLNEVTTTNMSHFDSSVPIEALQSLTMLRIYEDKDVESLGDFGRVFRACSSSLRTLDIVGCTKLRSVSEGLVYLNALESLVLDDLPRLNLANEGEEIEGDVECDGMPWGALSHTLQSLEISGWPELKTFPKWMQKLASLQELNVRECSEELHKRCRDPNGEDWPNIQHIPDIQIYHREL